MHQSHWEFVKDSFGQAYDMPEAERLEFLARLQESNQPVYDEVISLLAAAESPDNLIENNAVDLAAKITLNEPDLTGRHFGAYRIIREIGSGGMGAVFLAERDDGQFKMQVALKIVRHSVIDRDTLARFMTERQILASLHHPNIAVLHDGGITDSGEPYLAMEYIDGAPLTEYAVSRSLSIDDRLRLFLKVCSAVSFAHRNLVIHRDIKPSNILVTDDGEPKLLDFGLAKALDLASNTTQTTFNAFTPAYASPEQILGKTVNTSSDQYALGVVLFELLTGRKPFNFDGQSIEQIIRTIGETEASSPSAIVQNIELDGTSPSQAAKISRDLDTIVLKAIRIDPERRYASVDAFADDIERYLVGKPISARPNTFTYLASRYLRRNATAAAAVCLVVLAVAAGVAVSVWQGSIARTERDRATRRFNEVRQLSNSLLFEIAPKLERVPGSIEARELIVVKAIEYLDDLAAESTDDPDLNIELARAYEMVGDLQGNPGRPNIGDFAGAISSYEKAIEIYRTAAESSIGKERLADAMIRLAKTKFAQTHIDESISDLESATTMLNAIAAERPDDVPLQLKLASADVEKAQSYGINNQYDIAIPIYERAIAKLATMDQKEPEVLRLQATATAYLSNSLSWNGSQTQAEKVNQDALMLAEKITTDHDGDSHLMQAVFVTYTLASSTYETIKNDISLQFAERALQIARRSSDADRADGQARHNLARAHSRYGVVLVLVNRIDEGFSNLRQAQQILKELIAREPRNRVYQDDLGTLHTRLGDAEKNRRVLTAALREYKRSAEIYQRLAEADPRNFVARRDWAQALKSVAVTEIKIDRKVAARQNLDAAIALVEDLKNRGALGKWDMKIFDQMYKLRDDLK